MLAAAIFFGIFFGISFALLDRENIQKEYYFENLNREKWRKTTEDIVKTMDTRIDARIEQILKGLADREENVPVEYSKE